MNIFRLSIILLILLSFPKLLYSQNNDLLIKNFANEINKDSVFNYLEKLVGVQEITIDGQQIKISNRSAFSPTNHLAAKYLQKQLNNFGYDSKITKVEEYYNKDSSILASVENVTALKKGTSDSDKLIVLSAHYDASNPTPSQAADDNGSGTAAVLEIARVLMKFDTKHDILIALVDDEERGMAGSFYIADSLSKAGKKDVICINLDMMGYSRTDTFMTYVQYDSKIDGNIELGETAVAMDELLHLKTEAIPLDRIVPNATSRINGGLSDAYSFGNHNYSAINIMERAEMEEHNPCYHDTCDNIENMHHDYYFQNALLAGSIVAKVGEIHNGNDIRENAEIIEITVYPNPFTEMATISYYLDDTKKVSLRIFDPLGKLIAQPINTIQEAGKQDYIFEASNYDSGIYFYSLQINEKVACGSFIIAK